MKWVTREHPKTDRIACPWLIRKFIDADAEIVYVPSDQVLAYAEREKATRFDAPGATYTHRGNKCSFETLIDEYKIDDPAIALLAKIVHGADVSEDRNATPESAGLLAIADGFAEGQDVALALDAVRVPGDVRDRLPIDRIGGRLEGFERQFRGIVANEEAVLGQHQDGYSGVVVGRRRTVTTSPIRSPRAMPT